MAFDLSQLLGAASNVQDVPNPNGGPGLLRGISQLLAGSPQAPNGGQQSRATQLGAMFQAQQPQTQPVTATDPNQATPVDEVSVTGTRPHPQTNTVQNIVDANNNAPDQRAYMQIQQGYAPHTGMFGIHGTLRNVIGTLGDAFLARNGQAPVYRPQVQREQIADAMAGYATDPQHAIARVAALGVPGASDMAVKMQEIQAQEDLRKQIQEQNFGYRQSLVQDRQANRLRLIAPQIGAMLTGPNIKTADDYTAAANRANTMLQRISPDFSIADIGAVDPADWKPGANGNLGMSAPQVDNNTVKRESIDERKGAAADAHHDRQEAIQMRGPGAGNQPSVAKRMAYYISKQNAGQQLTPAEQKDFDKQTNIRQNGGVVIQGLTPQPGQGGGQQTQQLAQGHPSSGPAMNGNYPTFTKAQADSFRNNPDNRGKWFRGTDGNLYQFPLR